MASLGSSLHLSNTLEQPTRLGMTVSAQLEPLPVPGVWSRGPVYHRLDSGFLEQPLIPKAPLTPRLRIDQVGGTLRVFDSPRPGPEPSEVPPTLSLPELQQAEVLPLHARPRLTFHLAAIVAGFAAGLAAAFLFGWL